MEAIGTIASVTTLCQLATSAFELSRRFKDAPKELEGIARHLSCLAAEVNIVNELQKDDPENEIENIETRELFRHGMLNARQSLLSVNEAVVQCVGKHGLKAQIHWALLGKHKVTDLLADLGHTERSLSLMLLALLR
jgi:hypothetical protein